MQQDDKPFFLFLAYNAPHNPLQATKKYLDRFDHIENWEENIIRYGKWLIIG